MHFVEPEKALNTANFTSVRGSTPMFPCGEIHNNFVPDAENKDHVRTFLPAHAGKLMDDDMRTDS